MISLITFNITNIFKCNFIFRNALDFICQRNLGVSFEGQVKKYLSQNIDIMINPTLSFFGDMVYIKPEKYRIALINFGQKQWIPDLAVLALERELHYFFFKPVRIFGIVG